MQINIKNYYNLIKRKPRESRGKVLRAGQIELHDCHDYTSMEDRAAIIIIAQIVVLPILDIHPICAIGIPILQVVVDDTVMRPMRVVAIVANSQLTTA